MSEIRKQATGHKQIRKNCNSSQPQRTRRSTEGREGTGESYRGQKVGHRQQATENRHKIAIITGIHGTPELRQVTEKTFLIS